MAKTRVQDRGRGRPAAPLAPEVVDPAWLAKAFLVMVVVALCCGYLTLCGLFYRGQWQLVLHPTRNGAVPQSIGEARVEVVRFGAASTGIPQLTGWWIPADPGSPYPRLTFLYLRGGDGSLASDEEILRALHEVGGSILAFDYRGFGQSADVHPSERSMIEDAGTAWDYLASSRAISGNQIVPYGRGLGAAVALDLVRERPSAPAVVLDSPDFRVEQRVRADPRSRLLPVGLLFHERFALHPAIEEVRVPKLILNRGDQGEKEAMSAAEPRMTVALPVSSAPEQYTRALRRFLDQYAPSSPVPGLVPAKAP